MKRRAPIAALTLALCLAAGHVFAAGADAPHGDEAPRYDASADALVIARSGAARATVPRLAARRQQAQRVAERRARAGLVQFVDERLSRRALPPRLAAQVHRALEPQVTARRFLADGSVVVRMSAPTAPLRAAWSGEGAPW